MENNELNSNSKQEENTSPSIFKFVDEKWNIFIFKLKFVQEGYTIQVPAFNLDTAKEALAVYVKKPELWELKSTRKLEAPIPEPKSEGEELTKVIDFFIEHPLHEFTKEELINFFGKNEFSYHLSALFTDGSIYHNEKKYGLNRTRMVMRLLNALSQAIADNIELNKTTISDHNETDLLEKFAELEHEQWAAWANNLLKEENLSLERKERWSRFLVPYSELPDEIKESDRIWARKVFERFKEAYLIKIKTEPKIKPPCPHCGSNSTYLNDGADSPIIKTYWCMACKTSFDKGGK